ncbi:MAG: glycosyltransferase [Chloroflexota bacterium]
MHIGVLTHNYPRFPGDFSGIFVESLCEEFAAQQQQVTVWMPHDPAYDRSLTGAVHLHPYRYIWPEKLHRLGYMRSMKADLALNTDAYSLGPPMLLAGIGAILRRARRMRPAVLHAHWLLPNGFMGAVASRLLGIPLIISVPGSDAQIAQANPLFKSMAQIAMWQASLMTANSEDLREAVVDVGAKRERFDLIIYGTDPNKLRPDSIGVAELRTRLVIPNGAVVLLAVGRMVPKKGFDVLLKAVADVALAGKPVVAVLIGEGDYWQGWQELGQQLGIAEQLRWVGNVPIDQIGVYYNLADILVNPAVRMPVDGLNVCVLDAMSCGKPVVGSDVAGNPLAISDGETGFLVPEQDPAALAQALAKLVTNPALRQEMGQASRQRIEDELGWPHLARRYIQHFERLSSVLDDTPV